MSHKFAGFLGSAGMGTTLVLSYITAFTYFFSGSPEFVDAATGERLQALIFNQEWLAFTPKLVINLGFMLDPISAMMLVVIPTISFMVHVYSLGYMEGEKASSASMRSCRSSASLCSVWSWQPISSRCTYSGSL